MVIKLGAFTLDGVARQLRRGAEPIRLSPKAFDLLTLLVQRRPGAVSKAELHEQLWRDTFVSDVTLAVVVAEIRSALGDEARHPTFIRTVHRYGYAFSGTAVDVRPPRNPFVATGTCWLVWRDERVPLNAGENLIGRDPEADVRVDAIGVSRRHATIVVVDDEVTVQDLSSKNGTYVNNTRVTSPVRVTDGTELRLGPAVLHFRQAGTLTSTQTFSASRARRSRP